jgi:hypothetical protein
MSSPQKNRRARRRKGRGRPECACVCGRDGYHNPRWRGGLGDGFPDDEDTP